jgi:hypothetical protein
VSKHNLVSGGSSGASSLCPSPSMDILYVRFRRSSGPLPGAPRVLLVAAALGLLSHAARLSLSHN